MARIRSIHPEACTSEKLAQVGAEAERCYWRLQTHCDDAGRAEDNVRLIWAALFPLHEAVGPADVDAWLTELEHAGLLVRYDVDGRRCLAVTQWGRFQHPQRPKPSKIPEPAATDHGQVRDASATPISTPEPVDIGVLPGEGEGEGEGVGDGEGSLAPASPSRKSTPDPIWEAIVDCWQIDQAELTATERGRLNKATADLRRIGANPDEIPIRKATLERLYPSATWSPMAVAGRWAEANPTRTSTKTPDNAGPARAVLGRGVGAEPLYDLDERGQAVPRAAAR